MAALPKLVKTSRKKVYDCSTCKLDQNKIPVFGDIDTSEILIVRNFPSLVELKYKSPFASQEGRFLKQSLIDANIATENCVVTYSLLCNLPKLPFTLPIDQVKSCGINLIALIEQMPNLKLIIAIGDYPQKFFLGKAQPKKTRGELFKKNNLNIFPIYDIEYVLNNKNEIEIFNNDLIKARKIVNNEIKSGQDIKFLLCKTIEDLEYAKQKLNEAEYYSFDIETIGGDYGLDAFSPHNKIMTIGFTTDKLESFCIPVDHPETIADYTKDMVVKYLDEILHNNSKRLGHNIKFDIKNTMQLLGLSNIDAYADTMLANSLLAQGDGSSNNLKRLAVELLGYTENYSVLKDGVENDKIPLNDLARYNCEDTHNTMLVYSILMEKLKQEELYDLFFSVVMPGNEVLTEIELTGSKIDVAQGVKLLKQYEDSKNQLLGNLYEPGRFRAIKKLGAELYPEKENEIQRWTYNEYINGQNSFIKSVKLLTEFEKMKAEDFFNINSSNDIANFIYDELKLKCPKLTDTGKRSVDVDSLKKLENQSSFVADLLAYRKYEKAIGTYITPLTQDHLKNDGKIHCNYNQAVTATGRSSSSTPNLQNVPSRGDMGKEIKKMFVPSHPDWYILQADYSQIELRIAAIIANETNMLQAYIEDKDIHKITPATIFNKRIEDITKKERQAGKSINFGLIYGMSAQGLVIYAKKGYDTDFTLEQAEEIRNKYFKLYSGLPGWYGKLLSGIRKTGYVKNLFGRKRKIENINSNNKYLKGSAERQGINAPVQSSASDMLMLALYNINKYFKINNMKSRIINTVHDSIILECPPDELMRTAKVVKTIMENGPVPFEKLCPIKVDLEYGRNWGELEPLKI